MKMSNIDINNLFNSTFQKIQPIIAETLQQLFMKDFSIQATVSEEDNMAIAIAGEKFPSLGVRLISTSAYDAEHILFIEPELTLKLYAWMIGDEPEESITEAHIEGLQEAVTQICSQIQIQSEDTGLELSDISLFLAENSTATLESLPGDDGAQGTYIISVDGQTFTINHYMWVTQTEDALADSGPGNVTVSKAQFENFMTTQGGSGDSESMELLLDVELEVVAELGKKVIPIKDLLKIGTGSVVELEKSAGEPLDLLINGRKFGEGEVVVVEDHFGIRITQLSGRKEKETER